MIGRRLCAAALIAGAMTGAIVAAPTATAGPQEPLQVTITSCDSGGSRFICVASVTGGTAPYQKAWVNVQNAYFTQGGAGRCNRGTVQLRIDVKDADGAYASDSAAFACNTGPWP